MKRKYESGINENQSKKLRQGHEKNTPHPFEVTSNSAEDFFKELSGFRQNFDKIGWIWFKQIDSGILNQSFIIAVRSGRLDLVEVLNEVTNPDSKTINSANCIAAREGHLEIVKFLCTFTGMDPAAYNNHAINMAQENNHLDIVDFLNSQIKSKKIEENTKANKIHACIVKFARNNPKLRVELRKSISSDDPSYHAGAPPFLNLRDIARFNLRSTGATYSGKNPTMNDLLRLPLDDLSQLSFEVINFRGSDSGPGLANIKFDNEQFILENITSYPQEVYDFCTSLNEILVQSKKRNQLINTYLVLSQGYNDQNSFFRREGVPKEIINLISQHTAIAYGL